MWINNIATSSDKKGCLAYAKPNFVFEKSYEKDYYIAEVEEFITKNNHLPWVTSAKEEKEAVNMTRMGFETLEAVENIQLQIITLKNQNDELKSENDELKNEIAEIKAMIEKLNTASKTD